MNTRDDILSAFDIVETPNTSKENIENFPLIEHSSLENIIHTADSKSEAKRVECDAHISDRKKESSILQKIKDTCLFLIKYLSTSLCIFGILMIGSNYSAYWNIAYSIIYAQELEQTEKSLIDSVAGANIGENNTHNIQQVNTFKRLENTEIIETEQQSIHEISSYALHPSRTDINLGIQITPYENRIVIPTIGKNIPLIDIKQKKVEGLNELNDIFMKELENGVVRYPGSAKPGEDGNAFIFGHSSNNVWEDGEYNDVFALLDHVTYDDEVVVYYGQEKHTYKIRTKNVISPGDVSVLENDKEDISKITLMTCWPIGTTLNRLVLTGELISVE